MGYYRASFPSGGYTQEDIDSFYVETDGVKFLQDGGLFRNNQTFNSPINIGDNITGVTNLCDNCSNFNSRVKFGNNVVDARFAFRSCPKFNCPVSLSSNVIFAGYMLANCYSFNQPVTFSGAVECGCMFDNCNSFNQQVIIPDTVYNLWGIFRNCINFSQNVYIKGNTYRNMDIRKMFQGKNNSKRVNLFFNIALNNIFNRAGNAASMFGDNITWLTPQNNNYFFNAIYNMYCYFDYEG